MLYFNSIKVKFRVERNADCGYRKGKKVKMISSNIWQNGVDCGL